MKFWNSIVTRFALFFTGLVVFSILLSGYLVYRKASEVIIKYSRQRIQYVSELAEQSFYSLLGEVSNDISMLSESPSLLNYVNNPSRANLRNLNQLFNVALKNKASYFQIRLIGLDGKERIRFDKQGEQILESAREHLQEKGDRDYFKEAISIEPGKLYFSEINLNEEYGVISEPYIPTLRAASPVLDSAGQKVGIVIINVDLNQLYKNLEQISRSGLQIYLLDQQGQYLYAPDAKSRFGIQLNTGSNFRNDFGATVSELILKKKQFGILKDSDGESLLHYHSELFYFEGNREIYLVVLAEENRLLQSAREVRAESLQTLFLVCLASLLLSYLFVKLFSKRINRIALAISQYAEGNLSNINLNEDRKDEIGILARSFNKMKAKIDEQVMELNTALKKEKEAIRQRDEFLQNMSHEMRTPLNAILGLTALLQKNSPNEAQLPIINSLDRSANNLAGLVYDVLDHQKLAEGKVAIQFKATDIGELLRDIHASYQFEALKKGLKFTLSMDEKVQDESFQTDPLRLSQVIINLVVNAIKYTESGKVDVTAKILDGKYPLLSVSVQDTGVGILSDNLAKINERFYRETEIIAGRYGGYGLGLSIVKQIVELFGGKLEARSQKNKGSVFHVTIPVVPLGLEGTIARKPFQSPMPMLSNSYRILHIEDDPPTLELIRHLFESDHLVLVQKSREEGVLQVLLSEHFDLIISDLMLDNKPLKEVLSGWKRAGLIKCPLVVVSALEPEIMKDLSSYFLQKPFDLAVLQNVTFKILGLNEFREIDFSRVYDDYDHDPEKVYKVMQLLEEEFTRYMERINLSLNEKDQPAWEAIMHKLVTHVKHLNLEDLAILLQENVSGVDKENQEKINRTMAFYLCCIRVEAWLNSKG